MSDFTNAESALTHADIEEMLEAVSGPISGTDSNDFIYSSIQELWRKELKAKDKTTGDLKWYTQGYDYWENEENCPISDDGVLGRCNILLAYIVMVILSYNLPAPSHRNMYPSESVHSTCSQEDMAK